MSTTETDTPEQAPEPPCPPDGHDWDEIVEYRRSDPDGWLWGTGRFRCTVCGARPEEDDEREYGWDGEPYDPTRDAF